MNLVDLITKYVALHRASGNRMTGACPKCGGRSKSDKFSVYLEKENFHCFACGFNGDIITFLRELEGMTCPDAHEHAGRGCQNVSCPAWDKCRLGAKANGETPARPAPQSLSVPLPPEPPKFIPDTATQPEQIWQKKAGELIEKAHAKLLDSPEQLDYLASRGLPLAAVEENLLGWIPENRYPTRASWGLPPKYREDKKPKKHFIPAGILIPFFDQNGSPHRLRVRRSHPGSGGRYYWVDGSGNDIPVIGQDARAFVVVETDLDALMIRFQAGGLVGTIPLGSCSPKPKQWAVDVLKKALAILVALDYDAEFDQETGQYKNPGGANSVWWLEHFSRAKRWPVPEGKDPGEYFQAHSGDIRAWVAAGLPPGLLVKAPVIEKKQPPVPGHAKGTTRNGHAYVVAHKATAVPTLRDLYPEAVVFTPAELAQLKGMTPEEAELMLLAKKEFGGQIIETRLLQPGEYENLGPVPLPPEPDDTPQQELFA